MKNAKLKVVGLKAARELGFVKGKDPKKVITGNTVKGSDVVLPSSKNKKPMMKAKFVSKMGE